jgi:CheY-like chemotaxis protein
MGPGQTAISLGEEATNVLKTNPEFSSRSSEQFCCRTEAKETPATSPRKPGILVVDDDDAVRGLLDIGLRQYGFAVWLAANGQEAIQVYQQHGSAIDAVLLDVRMPGLDGPHTLDALAQLNPQIRSCFMTGQSGIYSSDQLLRMCGTHVFQKPFQLADVAQVLGKLIGSPLPRSQGPVP